MPRRQRKKTKKTAQAEYWERRRLYRDYAARQIAVPMRGHASGYVKGKVGAPKRSKLGGVETKRLPDGFGEIRVRRGSVVGPPVNKRYSYSKIRIWAYKEKVENVEWLYMPREIRKEYAKVSIQGAGYQTLKIVAWADFRLWTCRVEEAIWAVGREYTGEVRNGYLKFGPSKLYTLPAWFNKKWKDYQVKKNTGTKIFLLRRAAKPCGPGEVVAMMIRAKCAAAARAIANKNCGSEGAVWHRINVQCLFVPRFGDEELLGKWVNHGQNNQG